ncbi:MAG TPA: AtpZ/AtpI family protein [Nitrospirae bacterium]|nr:AtpZ/AtpI family protein [Nitrospirota bacterium]
MGKNSKKELWRQLLDASAIPLNLVAATFVGFAIGYGLDKLFGTSPYLTIIFFILGIIAGFRELFRYARRMEREDDKKDK